jgi:hypothetical protein
MKGQCGDEMEERVVVYASLRKGRLTTDVPVRIEFEADVLGAFTVQKVESAKEEPL